MISHVQVIQKAAALADHHEQSTARTVVLAVLLQMFREAVDPVGQQRNLDISRAGILVMQLMTLNYFRFLFHISVHFLLSDGQ